MLETIHLSTDPGSLILSICMLKRRLHVPPGMTLQSRGYGLILHGLIQYLLRTVPLEEHRAFSGQQSAERWPRRCTALHPFVAPRSHTP